MIFKAIDGADFVITLDGSIFTDAVVEASFKKKVKRQNNNSMNGKVISYSEGSTEYTGTITIKQWAIDDMLALLPKATDITDLPQTKLTIGYYQLNGRKNSATAIILFNEQGIESKGADDMDIRQAIELQVLSLTLNNKS